MSFASDVKKEVSITEYSVEDAKAFLYGYIKLKGVIGIENHALKLTLKSSSLSITRKVVALVHLAYNIDVEIFKTVKNKLNNLTEYVISIPDVSFMLKDLGLSADGYMIDDEVDCRFKDNLDKVIVGMFMARGSVNDPLRDHYHLEIVCQNDSEANFVKKSFRKFGITSHIIERKKGIVVYIKRSEDIGDVLKLLGTNQLLFSFENARIQKDYNNYLNRMTNCDIANGLRAERANQKQLDAIKIIEEQIGFATLSPRLYEGVILRTNNPDSTLQELSDVSEDEVGRYIPKSTLCHIMNDLVAMAFKKED